MIDKDGVRHSEKRVQGLVDMQSPATGADLQQLICATNWMRANIPMYNQLIAPLQEFLDKVAKKAGTRKKTRLARQQLAEFGWNKTEEEAMEALKKLI